MFIKYEKRKRKDDSIRTVVRVVESYRAKGTNKQRAVRSYGYLEDHVDQKAFIKGIEAEILELEKVQTQRIVLAIEKENNYNNSKTNTIYNYGYKYLSSIYDSLNIDSFFDEHQLTLNKKIEYNLKDIFKYYVIERVLNPDSKRASIVNKDNYYGQTYDFSLDDTYRSLDLIFPVFDDFQTYIRSYVDKLITPDYSKVYYDVTNYYCEIDFEDDENNLRHRGVSKEHRAEPIIGLGLFMDSKGLPIQVKVFNGNTSESKTLLPGVEELKKKHDKSRVIMIADKGLNTSANIEGLIEQGDGYIFSQILMGRKGKRYHEKLFDQTGWIVVSAEYKYKLYEEDNRKILLYWSKKDSVLQKAKRDERVKKAVKSIDNRLMGLKPGYEKYLKQEIHNSTTGECYSEKDLMKNKTLDEEKIEDDEKFDGYSCIITSELEYTEKEIRKYYHELWEIEETFRITKSDLAFRPIFHYKKEHITSHFLICYTALLLVRLFQYKLKESDIRLSAERITRVLNKMNLDCPASGYVHLHQIGNNDETWDDYIKINKAFDINYNIAYEKVEKFNKFLKSIIYHKKVDKTGDKSK